MTGRSVERAALRSWAAVLPAVAVVAIPALYALAEGLGASAGIGVIGTHGPNLDAYQRVVHLPGFGRSLALTVWVATASTVLAIAAGSAISWLWAARPGRARRVDTGFVHLTVSIPHVVWAAALAATLSQSGWVARLATATGLIHRPDQFPVLVGDRAGLGIIIHIATKEAAFVALATIPLASRRARRHVHAAATLGASRFQQYRLVFLPAIAPALLPAAVVVYAFGLGAYEPPAILGATAPRALSMIALDRFRDPDLTMRADAFAISTILAAITVLAAAAMWLWARRWIHPTPDQRR